MVLVSESGFVTNMNPAETFELLQLFSTYFYFNDSLDWYSVKSIQIDFPYTGTKYIYSFIIKTCVPSLE